MSRIMRKPAFCICVKKGTDQLCGSVQLISAIVLASYIVQSFYFLNPKFQASNNLLKFCGCTARFLSDLVGNPKNRFSRNEGIIRCVFSDN